MNSRFVSHILIFVIILCSGLVSCSSSHDVGHGSGVGNVIAGSNNMLTHGVKGGTISGGGGNTFPNLIQNDFGVISGGRGNLAGNLSTVGGGEYNHAEGIRATIGGGANNKASRNSAVVGGGYSNTASQSFATISGGNVNTADGSYTTISGGAGNYAKGRLSTISGGTRNQTQVAYSTIGGGSFNMAIGGTSTIAGGTRNQANGIGSSIGGGAGNSVAGLQSTISGGLNNSVSENYSVVAGGRQNLAGNENSDEEDSPYASVGGGYANQAGGAFSVVPGGNGNRALGDYSFAAGKDAKIAENHPGVFLFADSMNFSFTSSVPNEFAVRATGGVRFVTALADTGEPLGGVRLASGSGSWETLSDRNSKTGVLPVDGVYVLDALMNVPISTWSYKGQTTMVRHIGPMAQDFYSAFGIGDDERYIGIVDADGVALAAIQGLHRVVQEKDARISVLEVRNDEMQQRLDALEDRLAGLENNGKVRTLQINWSMLAALLLGLILGRILLAPYREAQSRNLLVKKR